MQESIVNNKYNSERYIGWFLLLWTGLNILQACTLELHADEAYYWMFSRYLDWGYFDHPPMVALFIRIGDSIVHNELGLRLVNILSSTFSMFLLWRMVRHYNANALWFILVSGGMFMLHIYGFITTPDGPLFFFTVLFLFVYRHYLMENKWWQAVLLGFIIACLLYSKYHAVLLIGFTLVANLKLLARASFWVIVLIAAALYLPHIYWQIQHDYPSVSYHLSDRSEKIYKFDFTSVYVLSQLLMAGPLVGWLWYYKAFTLRTADDFLRSVKVIFVGVIFFFLLSTARGEVQPQWTIIAVAALIVLVMVSFGGNNAPPLWLNRLAAANIVIIVLVRLLLVFQPPFVRNIQGVKTFFNYKDWAHTIKNKVGDGWLMMNDGFQLPARYCYYNNTLKCFSYDPRYTRLSQFEFWSQEDSVQGKRVYYLLRNPAPGFTTDTIQTAAGPWYGVWVDSVRTYQKVSIGADVKSIKAAPGQKCSINLVISNPYNYPISFDNHQHKSKVVLEACISKLNRRLELQQSGSGFNSIELNPGESAKYTFIVTAPMQKDRYDLFFSLRTEPFDGNRNSKVISFTVE